MDHSRRKFLKLFITAVGGGLAGYGAFRYLSGQFPDRIWILNSWLTEPSLAETPPGAVDEHALQILMIAAQTLLGVSIEEAHYETYFRWRSENLPGYKSLYEKFATGLDRAAQDLAGCDFIACEADSRYTLLEKAFEVRDRAGRLEEIRLGLFDREWLRFDRYIVREIFSLFARTDALILLGYDAWPGLPRGLDRYTQLPAGK